MKSSAGLRKVIIGIATVLVLGALLMLYRFFFVEQRTEDRIDRNFRVLNTIAHNFQDHAEQLPLQAANELEEKPSLEAPDSTNVIYRLEAFPSIGKIQQGWMTYEGFLLQERTADPESNKTTSAVDRQPQPATGSFSMSINSAADDGRTEGKFQFSSDAEYSRETKEKEAEKETGVNEKPKYFFESYIEFFERSTRKDAFDHYLVITPEGKVLYHSSSMHLLKFDFSQITKPGKGPTTTEGDEKSGNSIDPLSSIYGETQLAGENYHVFSTPFRIFDSKELVLIGLSSEKSFNRATLYIPVFYVLVISSVFVLLLLSYPFLKLLFISRNERLRKLDVGYALFALLVGSVLCPLLVIDYYQYTHFQDGHIEKGLETVSGSVKNRFVKNVDEMVEQLNIFDSSFKDSLDENGDALPGIDLSKDTIENSKWNKIKALAKEGLVDISWINEGSQERKWVFYGDLTQNLEDLSDRAYVKNVKEKKYWYSNGEPFVLQSIYSFNNAKLYAVFSKKSQDTVFDVVAATAKLPSVHGVAMSPGYSFAIINTEGRVLFHSDEQKSLQENLLDEVSNTNLLRSHMISRSPGFFGTSYHAREYLAHISPVKDWPLYLVTFYDKSYLNSANAEIFSFSIINYILYGLLVSALALFLFYYRSRKDKLNFRRFRQQWLLPQKKLGNVYRRVVLFQLALASSYLFAFFCIWGVEEFGEKQSLRLCLIYTLPVLSMIGTYLMLQQKKERKRKYLWPVLLVAALLLLFAVLIAIGQEVSFRAILASFAIPFFTASLIVILHYLFPASESTGPKSKSRAYRSMVVVSLLTLSLPLVYYTFTVSHDTEFLLYRRLVQLELAESIEDVYKSDLWSKPPRESKFLEEINWVHLSPLIGGEFVGREASATRSSKCDEITIPSDSSPFMKLYTQVRPFYNEAVVRNHFLDMGSGLEGSWHWEKRNEKSVMVYQHIYHSGEEKTYLELESEPLDYKLWDSLKKPGSDDLDAGRVAGFFLIVFLLFYLLYRSVSFLLEHIIVSGGDLIQSPLRIRDLIPGNSKPTDLHQKRILLLGIPKSGKVDDLMNWVKNKNTRVRLLDFSDLTNEDTFKPGMRTDMVILNHFEFGLHMPELNAKKLSILDNLLQHDKLGIVLASARHPLDHFDELLRQKEEGEIEEVPLDVQRWMALLGNFKKVYTDKYAEEEEKPQKNDPRESKLERFVRDECIRFPFLQKIEISLIRKEKDIQTEEEMILGIQSVAALYYNSVWENCTDEEKYLLLDLAQDGLVNKKNIHVVTGLINKGLIRDDGRMLAISNYSFRNFILTRVGRRETKILEARMNKESAWRRVRLILIVALVVIGIFLFYTQKDLLDNAVALITALGGILLTVTRFTSTATGTGGKNTT